MNGAGRADTGRSNLSGATLKKQSRRDVSPDATQTDLGPGAQP